MVEYEESGLVFRVSCENVAVGVAEFKTIDSLEDAIGLYFSDFAPSVVAKGAAIANMGETAADVTLLAIGAEDVQGEFSTRIEPKEKIVGIHSVWFPEVPFSMIDSIVAISDSDSQSLCGVAISSDADTSHFFVRLAFPQLWNRGPKLWRREALSEGPTAFISARRTNYASPVLSADVSPSWTRTPAKSSGSSVPKRVSKVRTTWLSGLTLRCISHLS